MQVVFIYAIIVLTIGDSITGSTNEANGAVTVSIMLFLNNSRIVKF